MYLVCGRILRARARSAVTFCWLAGPRITPHGTLGGSSFARTWTVPAFMLPIVPNGGMCSPIAKCWALGPLKAAESASGFAAIRLHVHLPFFHFCA